MNKKEKIVHDILNCINPKDMCTLAKNVHGECPFKGTSVLMCPNCLCDSFEMIIQILSKELLN